MNSESVKTSSDQTSEDPQRNKVDKDNPDKQKESLKGDIGEDESAYPDGDYWRKTDKDMENTDPDNVKKPDEGFRWEKEPGNNQKQED